MDYSKVLSPFIKSENPVLRLRALRNATALLGACENQATWADLKKKFVPTKMKLRTLNKWLKTLSCKQDFCTDDPWHPLFKQKDEISSTYRLRELPDGGEWLRRIFEDGNI